MGPQKLLFVPELDRYLHLGLCVVTTATSRRQKSCNVAESVDETKSSSVSCFIYVSFQRNTCLLEGKCRLISSNICRKSPKTIQTRKYRTTLIDPGVVRNLDNRHTHAHTHDGRDRNHSVIQCLSSPSESFQYYHTFILLFHPHHYCI